MEEQLRRKFAPAVPTTGAGDVAFPADTKSTEIRRLAWPGPQSIRFAALRVNQERHLINRDIFKDRRNAALTDWLKLCVA